MACYADINVSQGSVATYARCGGIFNIHLATNLPKNLPVFFLKSVKIWQNYGHESLAVSTFLAHPVGCVAAKRVCRTSNENTRSLTGAGSVMVERPSVRLSHRPTATQWWESLAFYKESLTTIFKSLALKDNLWPWLWNSNYVLAL